MTCASVRLVCSRNFMVRTPTKQAHVRFEVGKSNGGVTKRNGSGKLGVLVKKSVGEKTLGQYVSNIRALEMFLNSTRAAAVDVTTITRDEFIEFLFQWHELGKGPVKGVVAALKHRVRQGGKELGFLEDADIKKAMIGAASNSNKRDKSILSKEQLRVVSKFIKECEEEDLGNCSCDHHKEFCSRDRLRAALLMYGYTPVRPFNVVEMQSCHLNDDESIIHVPHLKTAGGGPGDLPIEKKGVTLFKACAETSRNGYLFPRCVNQHLGHVLRKCEVKYGWGNGLVFSVYCLRHTGMERRKKKVEGALQELVSGITAGTFRTVYTKTNRRAGKLNK